MKKKNEAYICHMLKNIRRKYLLSDEEKNVLTTLITEMESELGTPLEECD